MKIDGKETGSSSVTKSLARHRLAGKKPMDEPAGEGGEDMKQGASGHDHGGQEGGHEVIQQTVAEHGPAEKATVEHDGRNHTVTTHHGGHKHVSKGHPTVSHVAEHLSHAAGAAEPGMEEHAAEPMPAEDGDSLGDMGIEAE
jgi:hypothetical protein